MVYIIHIDLWVIFKLIKRKFKYVTVCVLYHTDYMVNHIISKFLIIITFLSPYMRELNPYHIGGGHS